MHFQATYQIKANSTGDAREWASAVAREQTIECIDEAVPHAFILEDALAKVVDIRDQGTGYFHADISFNADVTGAELPQLLNVLYGNSSIHIGVKLIGIDLPDAFTEMFPGPRFGIKGVRDLARNTSGSLVCAVLKPMGLSPKELASRAYQCVLGGADWIKDDHSLAMQKWAPFKPRVVAIAAAVAQANAETGRNATYAPSMLAPMDQFESRAQFAKDAGAGGYLVMPGLTGYDSVRFLAESDGLSMPIMVHPSGLGSFTNAGDSGLSHAMIYATYPKLWGADISIYPSFGGRYGLSKELCVEVAKACRTVAPYQPILPSPGGGMKLEFAPLLRQMYGKDAMFLFGGDAMRNQDEIAHGISTLKAALTAPTNA